jgi:NTP pyrophosphatase (non-canonical NTP hydrolase)
MREDLLDIINYYGVNHQQKKLNEEVYELNEAIMIMQMKKWDLESGSPEVVEPVLNDLRLHIAEEMADVCVMLHQFKEYYDIKPFEIYNVMEQKIKRQLDRISKE